MTLREYVEADLPRQLAKTAKQITPIEPLGLAFMSEDELAKFQREREAKNTEEQAR
jgi:hypothetical protein